MSELSSKFPTALQVGQLPDADQTELRVDEPVISTQGERFRDRDEHIMEGLLDGAAAPFDLDVNNLTGRGILIADGAATFNNTVTFNQDVVFTAVLDFPERALIFAGL